MREVGKGFASHRMLMEYSQQFYYPALENYHELAKGAFKAAQEAAAYLEKTGREWANLAIVDLRADAKPIMERGDLVNAVAKVRLGGLSPEDVSVELYHGAVSSKGDIVRAERTAMLAGKREGDTVEYTATVACSQTGQLGYSARALPKHKGLAHPFLPGLVRWA